MTSDREQTNQSLPFRGGQRDLAASRLVAAGGELRQSARPIVPTPTPPLKGWGLTPQDTDKRLGAAPAIGRGKNWGVSALDIDELQRRARHMRNNPTEPEKRLWRHLSNEQLDGHKFRRQQVIGWFIADFVCPQRKLIVEVDGDTHDATKDRLRDDILGERGYRVLRVTNDDVMRNMDGVLRFLSEALHQAERPQPNPVPGETAPGSFRSVRGTDRPGTPEGEGLDAAQKLLGISLVGSVG